VIFNKPVERWLWRADGQRAAGTPVRARVQEQRQPWDRRRADERGFAHHLPSRGPPPGRAGTRAAGELATGAILDIHVDIPLILTEGDLAAGRVEAAGVRAGTGAPPTWAENHIYRVIDGQITGLWPAGGPQPG
jgi:hypothetical protein